MHNLVLNAGKKYNLLVTLPIFYFIAASLCLILFTGTLLRVLGLVRLMLSAKTEVEYFSGLITVLNGVY